MKKYAKSALAKKISLILTMTILMVLVIVGAGCGKEEPRVKTDDVSDTAADQVYEAPKIPDWYVEAPLTGLMVDPRYIERRPVAIMVENAPAARPQSGLAEADIVYEVLAEGGISRFLAIYHSKDSHNVGPVRSARPYYMDRALEYDALYAHCGGSEEAKRYIKVTKIADMDEFGIGRAGKAFWRIKSRKAPHNLYGDTARIRELGVKKGYKPLVEVPEFKFVEEHEKVSGGTPAVKIAINYSRSYSKVSYTYQTEEKVYQRSNGGVAHKDNITGKQLTARNIIVQYTNTKIIDSVGRLKVQMTGRGKALLFMEGKVYEGNWEKKGPRSWTVFTGSDGVEFRLQPGQTWVQVVPANTRVEYE